MSTIFDNYQNLNQEYIPNNLPNCPPKVKCSEESKLEPCLPNKPYEQYDAKGNLIGYWWYYGNTITLDFDITGEVTYEGNDKYLTPDEFLKDKEIKLEVFNFRFEKIFSKVYNYKMMKQEDGRIAVIFDILPDLANQLVKGIYYVSLTVWKEGELVDTIFGTDNATFTIK